MAKSLELVGERWTLLVVRDLLRGPARFQDLQESLEGIAPNLLSDRLKLMEAHGLIDRRFYSDHPPRAEYLLTDRGRELGLVVGALAHWGSRHVHRGHRLVSESCGHPVKLIYYCATCGERIRGGDVRLAKRGTRKKPRVSRRDGRRAPRSAATARRRRGKSRPTRRRSSA